MVQPMAEYYGRAQKYFEVRTIEVPVGKGTPDRVMKSEGDQILRRVPAGSRVYAVTRDGSRCSSRSLAAQLEEMATYGPANAVFLIGGAFGLDAQVQESADRRLSLSDFTLPHDLARLVLLEQLYRAGTILRGEPYHKGS
jgi:23S rRNA (pseudouridine1915-N3)-methyltransferase